MPTVPRVQREVMPTALPAARLTAAKTAASTGAIVHEAQADTELQKGRASQMKWGAFANLGETMAQAGTQLGRIVIAERQRADEVAVMDAENKLMQATNPLLYDPANGALTKKGKNALGVPEETLGEFNEIAGQIESTLTTPRQKAAFARVKNNRGAQLDLTLRRHTLQEMQAYEANELKSNVELSVQAAINNFSDPTRVGYELGNAVQHLRQSGPRLGMSPTQIDAEVLKVQTATHSGVIDQYLATEKVSAAKAYFEEAVAAEQLSGDAQARIRKALDEGTLRKQGQETFDQIVATKPEDEWIKAARSIEDPKVRDEVENRLQHQININERASREAHEALVVDGKNIIDRTGDWRKIPPAQWSKFTVGEASALKSYAEHKVTQVAIKTDPGTYYQLTQMATSPDPAMREAFVKTSMMQFINRLSPSDFQEMARLQATVRSGDIAKAEALLIDPAMQNRMVDEALTSMGMDPSPKQPGTKGYVQADQDRVNEFRRSVRESTARLEAQTGKKATDADVQSIVDQLRTPTGQKMVSDGYFWDTYTKAFAFETAQAQASSVSDIPAGERQRIVDALRAKGKPVSDANVLQLFNTMLSITRKDR